MPNFAAVAFLDTYDLVASLPGRIGEFKAGNPRILTLRGAVKDKEGEYGYTALANRWPEVKNILGRIEMGTPQSGPLDLGRAYLEMLDPGSDTRWQSVGGIFATLHLPLRTNPDAIMYSGRENQHLLPGMLTIVDTRLWSAVNRGEWPRVHLVVDVKRTQDPERTL